MTTILYSGKFLRNDSKQTLANSGHDHQIIFGKVLEISISSSLSTNLFLNFFFIFFLPLYTSNIYFSLS